jgi:transposase-like protein
MGTRAALCQADKVRIYTGKLAGQTHAELAHELNCSLETVRKWWRRGRKQGLEGLRERRHGRKKTGILSQFDPEVAQKAKEYKRAHHRWGADRVLLELSMEKDLQGKRFPKRSRLAAYFKAVCPDCVTQYNLHPPPTQRHDQAQSVHEVWQMDNQEEIQLANGDLAIICQIRDPFGAAPITAQAFGGKVTTRSRKLTFVEFRQVLRIAFTEWQTLPDCVSTDNELRFIGNPSSDFPSLLTLYLVGLGIQHSFIPPATPTAHAQVERGHRSFDNLAFDGAALQDVEHLQAALDRERAVYLLEFPVHASDCQGRPPLLAHPELLHPRRFYQPELEPLLFSMQRVYDYLATFTFERIISQSGCVALSHQISIGRQFARQFSDRKVWVRCDPIRQEWVFLRKPENVQDEWIELTRRPIQGLTFESLTGLDPTISLPSLPVQLELPFPVR